ncbi:MAG: high light inducible protein [Nostoc sp.]|uniref:high light inducible protein n=1 Tax=Nostoc sp. TaxID=1180 RepID=UPI002FF9B66C
MGLYPSDSIENTYNGKVRNALEFGFTPQSELWNSRLAMVGFLPYLIWGLNGYNVIW